MSVATKKAYLRLCLEKLRKKKNLGTKGLILGFLTILDVIVNKKSLFNPSYLHIYICLLVRSLFSPHYMCVYVTSGLHLGVIEKP